MRSDNTQHYQNNVAVSFGCLILFNNISKIPVVFRVMIPSENGDPKFQMSEYYLCGQRN